jgi:hypothetical protein
MNIKNSPLFVSLISNLNSSADDEAPISNELLYLPFPHPHSHSPPCCLSRVFSCGVDATALPVPLSLSILVVFSRRLVTLPPPLSLSSLKKAMIPINKNFLYLPPEPLHSCSRPTTVQ